MMTSHFTTRTSRLSRWNSPSRRPSCYYIYIYTKSAWQLPGTTADDLSIGGALSLRGGRGGGGMLCSGHVLLPRFTMNNLTSLLGQERRCLHKLDPHFWSLDKMGDFGLLGGSGGGSVLILGGRAGAASSVFSSSTDLGVSNENFRGKSQQLPSSTSSVGCFELLLSRWQFDHFLSTWRCFRSSAPSPDNFRAGTGESSGLRLPTRVLPKNPGASECLRGCSKSSSEQSSLAYESLLSLRQAGECGGERAMFLKSLLTIVLAFESFLFLYSSPLTSTASEHFVTRKVFSEDDVRFSAVSTVFGTITTLSDTHSRVSVAFSVDFGFSPLICELGSGLFLAKSDCSSRRAFSITSLGILPRGPPRSVGVWRMRLAKTVGFPVPVKSILPRSSSAISLSAENDLLLGAVISGRAGSGGGEEPGSWLVAFVSGAVSFDRWCPRGMSEPVPEGTESRFAEALGKISRTSCCCGNSIWARILLSSSWFALSRSLSSASGEEASSHAFFPASGFGGILLCADTWLAATFGGKNISLCLILWETSLSSPESFEPIFRRGETSFSGNISLFTYSSPSTSLSSDGHEAELLVPRADLVSSLCTTLASELAEHLRGAASEEDEADLAERREIFRSSPFTTLTCELAEPFRGPASEMWMGSAFSSESKTT